MICQCVKINILFSVVTVTTRLKDFHSWLCTWESIAQGGPSACSVCMQKFFLTSGVLRHAKNNSQSSRARAEPDGTCAETRFRLSPKRMSPFKSAGSQFGRLLAAEVCASALVMLDTPCSEVVWEYWLPTPFTSFPFTSPPMHHHVPPHSERSIRVWNGRKWLKELYT